jgi:hypothetical protein
VGQKIAILLSISGTYNFYPVEVPETNLRIRFFQECSKKRSSIFHTLLADFEEGLKVEKRLRDERNAARKINVDQKAALTEAQSEIARLRDELEKSKLANTGLLEHYAEVEKKQKEELALSEERAFTAETRVASLTSQHDVWLRELNRLNCAMNSKYPDTISPFSLFSFLLAYSGHCILAQGTSSILKMLRSWLLSLAGRNVPGKVPLLISGISTITSSLFTPGYFRFGPSAQISSTRRATSTGFSGRRAPGLLRLRT